MIRLSTRVLHLRPALPAACVSRAFAAAPPVRARAAGAAPARIGRIVASSLAAASLAAALQAPRPAECAKRKQETPEVVKRARSMACAATTGVLYKYVFARPPRRLIRLAGIEYHGQTSTSGHCAPANVLAVKDGLHKRMSRTKGGAFYNLVRKAGWGAFDGPIEVARKSAARMSVKEAALKDWSGLPRIQVHNWLNKNEKKDIAVKARANTAIVPHPPSAPRLSLSLSRPRSPGLELTHPRPSRRAPGAARTCSTRRSRRSTRRRAGKATRRSTCTRWRAPS